MVSQGEITHSSCHQTKEKRKQRPRKGQKVFPTVPDAQKYFTDPPTGEDVVFFEKHKKAILYHRILERDATPGELYAKIREEVERARIYGMEDIISQDYNVRKVLSKLIKDVGYEGFEDDTTEVCLKEAGESDEVKVGIAAVQQLVAGPTKKDRNTTLAGVLKPWLLKYMGLKLQTRRDGRGHNRRSLYKMKPCPDIQEFRRGENTVYGRVIGRKRDPKLALSKQPEPMVQAAARGGSGAGARVGAEPQALDIRQFLSIKRRASCCHRWVLNLRI